MQQFIEGIRERDPVTYRMQALGPRWLMGPFC